MVGTCAVGGPTTLQFSRFSRVAILRGHSLAAPFSSSSSLLTAFLLAACFALSTHCRRTLVTLLRTLVDEGENFEAPRLNAEQRLAEYRAHRA